VREKLRNMAPEERRAYLQALRARRDARDGAGGAASAASGGGRQQP
jgi:hypothetical protein